MRIFSRPYAAIAVFLLGLAAVLPVEGQTFRERFSWALRGSVLFFPQDEEMRKDMRYDPAPLLPTLGASAAYTIVGPLAVEASLDIYGVDYDWPPGMNKAVLTGPDYRAAFVLNPILGISLLGRFDIAQTVTIRAYGGPSADLRICFLSYNLEADEVDPNTGIKLQDMVGNIAAYLWTEGRWFLPVAGLGVDYRVLPGLTIGLDGRVWFPLYRLWTEENLTPMEGWRFGVGFTASFR
jgi:hypothetical protein